MNAEEICARIDSILVDEFELEEGDVVPSARLREDLDLDSLDGVDLMVAIEKTFGVRIEDKVMMEMKTIGDIHAWVANNMPQS